MLQQPVVGWGWESHAFSLPGHAESPVQRPIRFCTLGYYLRFLAAEVNQIAEMIHEWLSQRGVA